MAPFTRSKGAAPSLDLPTWGNTKKATSASAKLPIHSKFDADLLGDLESPLTSMVSLWPDYSARGSGPVSIDERGLSSLPVKEESVASDDFDLQGNIGSHYDVDEPTSAGFQTALEPDLLDLREESIVFHPDDVRGWKTVGKRAGRHTPFPDPSSNLAGSASVMNNRFNILSNMNPVANKVTIDKTVKFFHDERQKNFEKQLSSMLNGFIKNCAAESRNDNDADDGYETEMQEPVPQTVNKGKVHEFCDTGIPGIEDSELDPENQCREWERLDFLKNEDPEVQKAIYESIVRSWKDVNGRNRRVTPAVAGPSTSTPRRPHRVEIVEEWYGEGDVSDRQSTPTAAVPNSAELPLMGSEVNPVAGMTDGHSQSTRRNVDFTPPITSTPMVKTKKKVHIVEECNSKETLDSETGANTGNSPSSGPTLLHASNMRDMRGCSPISGLNNPGNPHINLWNMIAVSRNAMHGGMRHDTSNVWTGPAFAVDQVPPNSFLGKLLKKSGTNQQLDMPPDDPGDPGLDSLSPSSDSESG
ncbi:hypothetical protein EDD18DRAFT_1357128 [Armillaria luteobubalina]|uniref:Uncharacterized protein n=1 Tax=Armillaria luteobubalina TaxID=153913 RepID=A0AA39UKJ6_9AGAR|nr:hypothetical protein EDD18DRAFT_1357128 [Armillaria luteobubalina]